MPIRKNPLVTGEYYHLYSRGVDKRPIFKDLEDKKRFVRLLFLSNGSSPVSYRDTKKLPLSSIERGANTTAIGAYCLMGNHFHLLVRETSDGGITKFMGKLLTAYSTYFNIKYERTGSLFGSKFKSEHLDTDEYLKYIFAYIHLNPLKIIDPLWKEHRLNDQKAKEFLDQYLESSYLDYATEGREESILLNRLAFPEYFQTQEEFKKDLFEWVKIDSNSSYPQFTEARPR